MIRRKSIILAVFLFCLVSAAHAFLFEVPILTNDEIVKLSDEKLRDTYIDVIVEVEALKSFYAKGGLVPKEYKQFKDILKYRIYLFEEMKKRKLEVPGSEPVPEPAPANLEIKE
ncbi:MAG: hypothetical protein A2Z88_03790 [Omnitrophica WOR_2 bacterium GWA2_47_8]|nr:MAG: hypothetical protein A2Z88_03790 [Omnitrophica WOR_2 bacterium GWA2_47_8]